MYLVDGYLHFLATGEMWPDVFADDTADRSGPRLA